MGLTNYYVDPSIAANSGSGTIGDPYGDLQYALDSITRDTTDGDQINIKAGTAEVLTASLDFSTYGTPSVSAGLVLRGYTSAADDGGVGEIDCGGFSIAGTQGNVSYVDLKIHNGPASTRLVYVSSSAIINCEVYDSYQGIQTGVYSSAVNCYVHDCSQYGIYQSGSSLADRCYVRSRSTDSNGAMNTCIWSQGRPSVTSNCIVSCDSNTVGIYFNQDGVVGFNNSVLSNGGTGFGLRFQSQGVGSGAWNNIVEGFSGTGGTGIQWTTATPAELKSLVANNTIYDCDSTIINDNDVLVYKQDNDVPAGSPFQKSGSDTFANRFTYFEPNTTYAGTNIGGNGYRGAVAAPSGGGTTKHPLARF